MELNLNKSCVPDGIHPKLLKTLSDELSEPLAIDNEFFIATNETAR